MITKSPEKLCNDLYDCDRQTKLMIKFVTWACLSRIRHSVRSCTKFEDNLCPSSTSTSTHLFMSAFRKHRLSLYKYNSSISAVGDYSFLATLIAPTTAQAPFCLYESKASSSWNPWTHAPFTHTAIPAQWPLSYTDEVNQNSPEYLDPKTLHCIRLHIKFDDQLLKNQVPTCLPACLTRPMHVYNESKNSIMLRWNWPRKHSGSAHTPEPESSNTPHVQASIASNLRVDIWLLMIVRVNYCTHPLCGLAMLLCTDGALYLRMLIHPWSAYWAGRSDSRNPKWNWWTTTSFYFVIIFCFIHRLWWPKFKVQDSTVEHPRSRIIC